MAQELSPDNKRRVEQALSDWKRWPSAPVRKPTITSNLEGDTNLSFKLSDGISAWVLRLNTLETDSGIDRSGEIAALKAAHKAGLAPQIEAVSSDFLITQFISGPRPDFDDLPEIGQLFHKIHHLSADMKSLDLLKHIERYASQCDIDVEIEDCINILLSLPCPSPIAGALCHQDLTLQNILKTDGRLIAIDWEYARISDPAYDLAVFITVENLGEDQSAILLHHYNNNDPKFRTRIDYYKPVYRMIEILWWLMRGKRQDIAIKKLNIDLA
jgi:thiamine kinase-like enzyme